jgi:hypothetical protein
MIARAEAHLPLPADEVWRLAKRTATQLYLSRRAFAYSEQLPPVRGEGYEAEQRLRLLGVIPAWRHRQRFERVDDDRREIVVRESGAPYRLWDHRMRVEPTGPGTCRFLDSIEVEGRLRLATPVLWLAATRLCASRMRRLGELARILADPAGEVVR